MALLIPPQASFGNSSELLRPAIGHVLYPGLIVELHGIRGYDPGAAAMSHPNHPQETTMSIPTANFVLAVSALTAAAAALAADPKHDAIYAAYERAVNSGDADAASAFFATDGVIRGTRFCPADNPCAGREAVRDRFYRPLVQLGLRLSPLDAKSEGDALTVRLEARNKAVSNANFSRVIIIDRIVIRDGLFDSIDTSYDRSDPETAQFLASVSAPPPAQAAK
jgi:SnoaL-like domain